MMWFGIEGGGVSRYDRKTFVNLTAADGLKHNYVSSIHSTPDGMMWLGTRGGVSQFECFPQAASQGVAPTEGVGARLPRPYSGGRGFINFTTTEGLSHNHVHTIYRDPDGMMWFGTDGHGIFRYDGEQFVPFTTQDGLASNWIRTIDGAPDGSLWVGTDGGVSRYDGKKFIKG